MIYFIIGHLENLLEASKIAEKIVVGVKSDELVKTQKNRNPYISAEERMEILRHFKFIDNVFQYYTRDAKIANSWIKRREGTPIDVIILGEDLRNEGIYEDFPIIYTNRPPEIAKKRSTTNYTKKIKDRPKKEAGRIYTGEIEGMSTYIPLEKKENINNMSKEKSTENCNNEKDISDESR